MLLNCIARTTVCFVARQAAVDRLPQQISERELLVCALPGVAEMLVGTHSVPRVDPGFFAVRVHGQAGHGFCRRRSNAPPQPR